MRTAASAPRNARSLTAQSKAEPSDRKETGATQEMLDAHEALCEAAPENFSRFKDVLEYLKQDLASRDAAK